MNKKRIKVTDGGYAIPLGNDYFLMREEGGIGIGENKKNSIEVENGEVVKVGQKDIKVFSDQPMLNGISPANALLMGARPKDVFTAQQTINGNSHGTYGKDGLIKNIVNWIKGSNDNVKSNKEPEPIDWDEIKLRQAYAESGFDSDMTTAKGAVWYLEGGNILIGVMSTGVNEAIQYQFFHPEVSSEKPADNQNNSKSYLEKIFNN